MPMPTWWGQINKRVFNPLTLRTGKLPVIHHVGRSSGTAYATPLEAAPVEGGFIFTLVYSSRADWVQNVLAAGSATLEIDDEFIELTDPQLLDAAEAFSRLPADAKRPPKFLKIDEFLEMRTSAPSGGRAGRAGDDAQGV